MLKKTLLLFLAFALLQLCAVSPTCSLNGTAQADSLLNTLFPASNKTNQKAQALLHGNTESKVYHASDCEYYDCKACTQRFSSAREAESQGYHPCSICKGIEGTVSARNAKGSLHANPESKVVHGPSCKYYHAKNSSVVFSSIDAAKRQGYRLCSLCQGR